MRVILASKSPRRKELLSLLGLEFEIMVSTEEEVMNGGTTEEIVKNLAIQKAENVEKMLGEVNEDTMIIGADTVVACKDEILGKPKNSEDAFRMIKLISGCTHQVYTGVCVIIYKNGVRNVVAFANSTDVDMYDMTDEEINDYIDNSDCEWADKAGAYAIQGFVGAKYIQGIKGDYNNVVGLPVSNLYQAIKGWL